MLLFYVLAEMEGRPPFLDSANSARDVRPLSRYEFEGLAVGYLVVISWPSEIGRDNPRWVKELGAGDIMFQEARVIKDVWKIDQLPCEIILAIRSADSKGVPCC